MIAVDTSALIAITFDEPERDMFMAALKSADTTLISAASVVEAQMVVFRRRGDEGLAILRGVLELPVFEIVPPGPAEIAIAHAAFVKYGKGNGHPAQLNFGDLFSYALAKSRGVPLLFKGDDFALTDVEVAG